MTAKFVIDKAGNEAVLQSIASGLHAFAGEAADQIRARAPQGDRGTARPLPLKEGGYYQFFGKPGGSSVVRYRKTIGHSTWLNGHLFAGPMVRGIGRTYQRIYSVVYSTSFTAHLLEFGSAPHEITVRRTVMTGPFASTELHAKHPGSRRYPHFWPGLASAIPGWGAAMAKHGQSLSGVVKGRINTKVL